MQARPGLFLYLKRTNLFVGGVVCRADRAQAVWVPVGQVAEQGQVGVGSRGASNPGVPLKANT